MQLFYWRRSLDILEKKKLDPITLVMLYYGLKNHIDYNKKLLELNFKKNGNLFCYKNISININYEKGVPYFIYFRNNPDCSVIK